MTVMLDTNTCIWIMNQDPRLSPKEPLHECAISQVVLGELEFGVFSSREDRQAQNRAALEDFLSSVAIAPLSNEVARGYGRLRADLKRQGRLIGPNDLWIAAHALCLDLLLVTGNTREFSQVANLLIDGWLSEE